MKAAFNRYLQNESMHLDPPGAGEDFSLLATACGAPVVYMPFGYVKAVRWENTVEEDKFRVTSIPSGVLRAGNPANDEDSS